MHAYLDKMLWHLHGRLLPLQIRSRSVDTCEELFRVIGVAFVKFFVATIVILSRLLQFFLATMRFFPITPKSCGS